MQNFYYKIKLLQKSNQTYPGTSYELYTQALFRGLDVNIPLRK